MRLRLAVAFLISTAFTPALAADITAQSHVDAVTVFPTGAEIDRVAEAKLEAGENTLIFDNLPGDLMAETIRVEGSGDGKIEIGSVDSKVIYLPSTSVDAQRKALEAEIQKFQDERAQLDQIISDAEYQKSLMQQLASGAFTAPSKDGEEKKSFDATDLSQLLDVVGSRLLTLSRTVLDSRTRQREIDIKISDLSTQLQQIAPAEQMRTRVAVHLAVPASAAGMFHLKYRISQAGWQPVYDARLTTPSDGKLAKIELVRRAAVVQSTTENWDNVALTLSTARPVGATAAPEMYPELIGQFEEGRVQNYKAKSDANQAPMPESQAIGGSSTDALLKPKDEEKVAQIEAQVQVAGFQALYAIPGRVSIDNTGTAKNVRISTGQIDAKLKATAVPKLDPNAYLTAAFTLSGDTPLLSGNTMLYRDGVFMGQGYLPMLSPGEETKLGFGADDLIKVKRVEVKRQISEEGIITSSNADSRAYDITVKNLHGFTIPVTIVDQMPYSELEDIVVEMLPGMTPPTTKDVEKKRGVLAWSFDLEPKADKIVKHGFKVTWPKDMKVGLNLN